jgi:hypothetical protein
MPGEFIFHHLEQQIVCFVRVTTWPHLEEFVQFVVQTNGVLMTWLPLAPLEMSQRHRINHGAQHVIGVIAICCDETQ